MQILKDFTSHQLPSKFPTDIKIQIDFISKVKGLKYLPSSRFQQKFLKSWINDIEKHQEEVEEELLTYFLSLLSQKDEPFDYKTFYFANEDEPVLLKQSNHLISQGTTGLSVWEASHFLLSYFLKNRDLLSTEFVLELGSGVGLLGLGLMQYLDKNVILTDLDSSVLSLLSHNLSLQSKNTKKSFVLKLEWGNDNDLQQLFKQLQSQSVSIVASDVLYDPELVEPFLWTLEKILLKYRTTAWVALTKRNPETFLYFQKILSDFSTLICDIEDFESTYLLKFSLIKS